MNEQSLRQTLFNAADIAMKRLCEKRPDLRTIAMQLRDTASLVLEEVPAQPKPEAVSGSAK